ncbi:MAG: integrase arm-type DNA-binding domain-containing protein [Halodesulfovibrio sp.]|uniref:integrase arm-type DNA-binding domain-containing protein n=1 Tax=Halodesulfovibrio sp. TaxID=1912772 RepID=UPI00359DFDFE
MKLNVMQINAAKPEEKAYILSDGEGLQLEVTSAGKKLWHYRYQMNGQENHVPFGSYPEIGLRNARCKRKEAEALIARSVDPAKAKDGEGEIAIVLQQYDQMKIEACRPLKYRGFSVVPTLLLAKLYGCEKVNIKMNFNRNRQRFVEGKHFFKIGGEELKQLKNEVTDCYPVKIGAKVNSLTLWTERGAARHAKILETDAAWDVFEKLEDAYFNREAVRTVEKSPDGRKYLHRYAELDVITSLTVANELQLDHSNVVANVFVLEQPQEVFELNFPIGEEIVQGRERLSVVAMTQAGFNLLMQNYSGKRVNEFVIRVAEEFALCPPSIVTLNSVERVKPRFIKPRIEARRMLALKGALRVYSVVENRTYEETSDELCAYFNLARLEDIGIESYDIALEYVWAGIERPHVTDIQAETICSDESASMLRGALDLWAYHAESRSYQDVMEDFEATTGLPSPNVVPEKDVLKILLIIWGKLSAALALKEAC